MSKEKKICGVERTSTVVPGNNDHLYNRNFDFRRNFFGNRSFLIKIYYIITKFALSDTDSDSRQQIAFFDNFLFIKMTEKIIFHRVI